MGHHSHNVTGVAASVSHDFTHTHAVTGGKTDAAGEHTHNYYSDDAPNQDLRVFQVTGPPGGQPIVYDVVAHAQDQVQGFSGVPAIIVADAHTHNLKLDNALGPWSHDHLVNGTAHDTGATDIAAHTGSLSHSYVDNLSVELDGVDITPLIVTYLNGLNPGKWLKLGDGTPVHALAGKDGTGGIELKQLGIEFPLGAHKLVFSVPAGKGGQIHYNLYVS
jgi:hypothetical protein